MSHHASSPRSANGDEPVSSTASSLFDVRTVIGGLFVFYGVVVTVTGFVDSAAAEEQAAGIDINVWSGLAMLVFGIGMLGWLWLSRRNAARGESG
ncbi:MAG: hypothetical protein H0W95_02210 [Nocardioidaceae bacterium]|nr:hypothetical protein [Nocardioidaceae bacterium]